MVIALLLVQPVWSLPVRAQDEEVLEEPLFDVEPIPEEDDSTPTITDPDELYQVQDNPLSPVRDTLELLIQTQINDDLWAAMVGDLPCVEPTQDCIAQLQEQAVQNNVTLRVIQERVDVIEAKIEEARAANQQLVQLDIFEPLVQRYIRYETVTVNGQVEQRGFFDNLLEAFTNPVNAINEALSLIGIPLLRGVTQTNVRAQQNAIAISDLQVKVAAIEQEKRKIEDAIREEVVLQVLDFDVTRREFQISQEIARRAQTQHQLLEIDYRFSDRIDTITYLGHLSQLDQQKAQTYRAWAKMRSQLARIKLLVLGTEGS